MTEDEYKECKYIDTEMRFYTFEEFKSNARAIKRMYDCLNHKIFYKWYIYSNIHLTLKQKNIAWAFLNHDVGYAELDNFN